jgi:hypothetical protein
MICTAQSFCQEGGEALLENNDFRKGHLRQGRAAAAIPSGRNDCAAYRC